MRPSTLTLRDLTFLGVHIDVDMDFTGQALGFDFEGVKIQCGVRHGRQTSDDSRTWWVGVNFVSVSDEEKRCPYAVEIKAAGLFTVDETIAEDKREAFVYESGAAMVYGAIREMVATITGRSVHGPFTLPTASFFGSFTNLDAAAGKPEDGANDE